MQALILVLSFMLQHGVTLSQIEFETVFPHQYMHLEPDCHVFEDPEGKVIACVTDMKVITVPNSINTTQWAFNK